MGHPAFLGSPRLPSSGQPQLVATLSKMPLLRAWRELRQDVQICITQPPGSRAQATLCTGLWSIQTSQGPYVISPSLIPCPFLLSPLAYFHLKKLSLDTTSSLSPSLIPHGQMELSALACLHSLVTFPQHPLLTSLLPDLLLPTSPVTSRIQRALYLKPSFSVI